MEITQLIPVITAVYFLFTLIDHENKKSSMGIMSSLWISSSICYILRIQSGANDMALVALAAFAAILGIISALLAYNQYLARR